MTVFLGTVQTGSAGEYQIGAIQQLLFALDQFVRSAEECRKFVHAVVNYSAGF